MKSLAPIVFFAYNRPEHTRMVLESLSNNKHADESRLWILVDGLKMNASSKDKAANAAVKEVVREKKWCKEVTIIESEHNKGLVKATIEGITRMVNEYGKVIALEDDNYVSPGFLTYMNDALDFYEDNPRVMHVSAFARPEFNPVDIKESTFFFYHTHTWGWGTWKRAWDKFNPDAMELRRAVREKGNIRKLNMDNTFEFYWGLWVVAKKNMSSWNTIWHSVVFLHDGLVLYPRRSMVANIGHDGTGTNCVPSDRFDIDIKDLADHIPVTPIPLQEHEGVRNHYISLHPFTKRLKFTIKHYLRYLMK